MTDIVRFLSQEGPAPVGPYSSASKGAGLTFLSGVIAIDPATNNLVVGDFSTEVHRVLDNIGIILKEMGLSFSDILKTTIFVTDMTNFPVLNQIYQEYFVSGYPARSVVEVSKLPLNARLEIEVIAVENRKG